jgi:hypothetical protein
MRALRLVACLVWIPCVVVVAGCAGHRGKQARAVPPPVEAKSNTPTAAEVEADVMIEAKKTAIEQLQCTEEEVTVSCTRRDVHGGCVAVQARGCGRTLEYDFGNDG